MSAFLLKCCPKNKPMVVHWLPPLLPPPLGTMCLALAPRPPGPRCWLLLWLRDEALGLEMVLSSCSMEQRSAIRASRSTVSPWLSASAGIREVKVSEVNWTTDVARVHSGCDACSVTHHLYYTLRSGRRSWPCWFPAAEEASAGPSEACRHPDSTWCNIAMLQPAQDWNNLSCSFHD